MNNQLGITSILLLLFYVGWFAWDQRKIIEKQNQEIIKLNQQLIFKNIVLDAALQDINGPVNKQKYNKPQKHFNFQ
jgi:hypothetical protein